MGNSNSRRRSHNDRNSFTSITSSSTTSAVIENYTAPTGLYPTCEWDQKIITRLINDKKLAPRHKGTQVEQPETEECPICFLNYTSFNNVNCCNNYICTECYLQVKSPKGTSTCPFCNNANFGVTYHPSKRQVSSTSVTTPPSSPPSSSSSPIPLSTPSPVSDPSKSLSQSPPVMSAEARRQLEREMAVQRADHITSEQYVESRYRASSWGSRNDASSQSSSRRNTFGPTRSTFRRERDRVRRGDNHRDESRNMRTMGLHDIELDNEDDFERYGQTGAAFRTDPSIFEEILQESRIQTDVDEINQDGMSLQQLEEMMIREAIRISMNENASANSRSSAPFPAHLSQVASPAPRVPTRAEPSSVESIAPIDFGDDEDAMLEYALTLSRQLSQPDQSQPVTPPRNAPISQTTSTQDLSPSALRLIDLIEEALSIPLPSGGDSQNSSSSSSSSSSSDSRNHGYGSFGSHSSDEY